MSTTHPSLLIVGTGAMACLFAARLAAAGLDVCMLGSWPEGLATLRQRGVTVVDPAGDEHTYPVCVTDDPCAFPQVRFVLVLVKSWQTERAIQQLAECLSPEGVVLTLQNGMGNREKLSKALGSRRVALGVATLGANLLGPGRVRPAGEGVISLSAHPRLAPLAGMLRSAGFIVENAPDPDSLLWGKLVINAAINPLTALLGVRNGALLERPTARALLAAVVEDQVTVELVKLQQAAVRAARAGVQPVAVELDREPQPRQGDGRVGRLAPYGRQDARDLGIAVRLGK